MKFLCLAYGREADWRALTDEERSELLAQDDVIRARGAVMAAVEPRVTTVTNHDRALNVSERSDLEGGSDASLPLAGFSVIEAESVEEVVALVSNTPCARAGGRIDIRPFWGAEATDP